MTHKVYWHPTDPNILVSSSQERSIKLWDIRQEQAVLSISLRDSSKDVRFSPKNPDYIVSAEENGYVEQTVYCMDFNPMNSDVFATGGLDKKVILWNINEKQEICELSSYNHIVGVGAVKWSNDDPRDLVVAGFSMNNELHVVKFNNPHRPEMIYQGHNEPITAILFDSQKRLITTSKDSMILSRNIRNGYKPYEFYAKNLVTVDLDNTIGFHFNNDHTKEEKPQHAKELIKQFKSVIQKEDYQEPQSIGILRSIDEIPSPKEELSYFAQNYIISSSKTLREKAEHNSQVARKKGKTYTANLWMEFAEIFCREVPLPNMNISVAQRKISMDFSSRFEDFEALRQSMIEAANPYFSQQQSQQQHHQHQQMQQFQNGIPTGAPAFNANSSQINEINKQTSTGEAPTKKHEAKEEIDAEMIFKYFENDPSGLSAAISNEDVVQQSENTLYISQLLKDKILDSIESQKRNQEKSLEKEESENRQIHPLVLKSCMNSLQGLVDEGELQSALVIAILFKQDLDLDSNIIQQWSVDLIELMRSYQLYNYANLLDILINTRQETNSRKKEFLIKCQCGQTLVEGSKCDSCKRIVKCSFCKLPVKGLLLWCQYCAHGGHLHDLKEWFKSNKQCPTGCGHNCFSNIQLLSQAPS